MKAIVTSLLASGSAIPRLPLLCVLLFSLAGCGIMSTPDTPPDQPKRPSLSSQAESAWSEGDFKRAQSLYGRMVEEPSLGQDMRSKAYDRLIACAIKNREFTLALDKLPAWRRVDPAVVNQESYHDVYFEAILGLDQSNLQESELLALSSDESLPWRLRSRAGITLAVLHLAKGDAQRPMMILPLVWKQALGLGGQEPGYVEKTLLEALSLARVEQINQLQSYIPDETRTTFPYTILELEKARRMANSVGARAQGLALAQRIKPFLKDPSLADNLAEAEPLSTSGQQSIALALPLTGPYGEVASKIMRGALIAQREMAEQGTTVDVRVVNSEAPSWLQDIENLPSNTMVVGGPLRLNKLKEMLTAQVNAKRAFFTFLPTLGQGREGFDAWRFFASPNDQVSSLVDVAATRFGVFNAAVLYPDESYGRHMADLFSTTARADNLLVQAKESYPTGSNEAWSDIVARIVGTSPQAVFIPGDWGQAEQLAPYFAYHQAKDVLILGPSLWAQAIARKGYVEMASFRKAVFPGSWWPDNPGSAAVALKQRLAQDGITTPDFWNSLGYDFVRFAVQLGDFSKGWSPQLVNERVQYAQTIEWSQAPIEWSPQGVATQRMFMFKPTREGFTILDSVSAPGLDESPLTQPRPITIQQTPAQPAQ